MRIPFKMCGKKTRLRRQLLSFVNTNVSYTFKDVLSPGGHRGRDCMVIEFTIIYGISAYHH